MKIKFENYVVLGRTEKTYLFEGVPIVSISFRKNDCCVLSMLPHMQLKNIPDLNEELRDIVERMKGHVLSQRCSVKSHFDGEHACFFPIKNDDGSFFKRYLGNSDFKIKPTGLAVYEDRRFYPYSKYKYVIYGETVEGELSTGTLIVDDKDGIFKAI